MKNLIGELENTKREFDFMVKPEHSERLWYVVDSLLTQSRKEEREKIVEMVRGMAGNIVSGLDPTYKTFLWDIAHKIETEDFSPLLTMFTYLSDET
jgi:hypothetical protein